MLQEPHTQLFGCLRASITWSPYDIYVNHLTHVYTSQQQEEEITFLLAYVERLFFGKCQQRALINATWQQ